MRFNIEITYSGVMAEAAKIESGSRREARFFNKVIKPAFKVGLAEWHRTRFPLRFKTEKYKLFNRSEKYNKRKIRVLGNTQPLVSPNKRGAHLKQLTVGPHNANVVSRRKRGTGIVIGEVKLRGARKVNRMHRAKREAIRRELYLLLPSDWAFLDKTIQKEIVRNWAVMVKPMRIRKKIK